MQWTARPTNRRAFAFLVGRVTLCAPAQRAPITIPRNFRWWEIYGLGRGVGRGLAVGPDLGVGVGRGVTVADAVAVGLAVGVAVAVGVGVGVPPPTAAKMSTRPQP